MAQIKMRGNCEVCGGVNELHWHEGKRACWDCILEDMNLKDQEQDELSE